MSSTSPTSRNQLQVTCVHMRERADNGGASEKSTPQEPLQQSVIDNSIAFSSPTALDPPENVVASYQRKDGSAEGEVVSARKSEAAPATSVHHHQSRIPSPFSTTICRS
ncbi:unnamed protein product [Lactuca virosa]|uniref:Uncharacterized protein n=1 Tax=Lactuca virosa TaxID=75947 RepID=A0AAU9M5Z8_9ASTR|nr:unnamed protein product [Lactuca virosa]